MKIIKNFIYKNRLVIILSLIILIASFFIVFAFWKTNYIYNAYTPRHTDKFYSFDEDYYAKCVYTANNKDVLTNYRDTIVKHPLFTYGANIFAKVENKLIGNTHTNLHYINIVLFQIILTLIASIFLYKIFTEITSLSKLKALILCLIFYFSNAVLLCTFFAETFIISNTLLILSYYFLAKEKPIIAGLLGTLVFGITITNVVIWGLLFLALTKNIKNFIKTTLAFIIGVGICLLILTPEYRDAIFNLFIPVVQANDSTYSDHFTILEALRRIFFFLGASPLFYIDTTNTNQLGTGIGQSVSFIPSSNIVIIILTVIWIGFLIFACIKNIKNRNVIACILVLLYTLAFHGIKQFGLKEAFLYSLHHLFAQIILISYALKSINKIKEKYLYIGLIIFFITELIINFDGLKELYNYVMYWKSHSLY